MPTSAKACNLVLAAALTAIALVGCSHRQQRPAAPPPSVRTVAAMPGVAHPSLLLSGIVAPAQSVALSSSLAEPALAVNVQEGDRVRQGQVLAVLDTTDLRATLEYDMQNAQSNEALTAQNVYSGQQSISQGNDQVRQAQVTLANAQRDLARYQQLYRQGYLSQQQYQTQLTTVQNDQAALASAVAAQSANGTMSQGLQAAKIAQAQAQAQASLAQADQTRASITKATIRSPVNGVVVNRNLNPGEYPGTRQIFTLQETDYVFAVLSASSSDVFAIPSGAPASVAVTGRPVAMQGRVVAVLDQLTPGSTNFAVKVRVPNPQGSLHSGMAVTGSIALAPISGIAIPYTAFLDDNHNTVMLVQPDDTVRVANVVERGNDRRTAIVIGLASGARVVADGQAGLTDGQKVAAR